MPSDVNSNHHSILPSIVSSVMHENYTLLGPIILSSVTPTRAHSDTPTDALMRHKVHIQKWQIFIFNIQHSILKFNIQLSIFNIQ